MTNRTRPFRLDLDAIHVLETQLESLPVMFEATQPMNDEEYLPPCSTDDVICIDKSIRC